jgi:gluconolactonase
MRRTLLLNRSPVRRSADFAFHSKSAVRCALFVVVCLAHSIAPAADQAVPKTVAPGAKLVEVYAAKSFFEGPTWDPAGGKLYFTSFPEGTTQILRLDEPGKVTVWMDKTDGVNGTYLSTDGKLLGAQAFGHRVVCYGFGPDGPLDPRVLLFDKTLNQPNDICQTPNGDIYFTDPDFDKRQTSAVFRLAADGKATKVITDMDVPNGLIASNDGKTLYVGDSFRKLWRAYPIVTEGNLYFSGRGGVWVVTPEGKSLGLIAIPEFCSNVTFGGADGKTLYMTCANKVYGLQMTVRGGQFPRQ